MYLNAKKTLPLHNYELYNGIARVEIKFYLGRGYQHLCVSGEQFLGSLDARMGESLFSLVTSLNLLTIEEGCDGYSLGGCIWTTEATIAETLHQTSW